MKNDATIKSDRAGAAAYNGMACKVLREVEAPDPAFNDKTPQVVVLIDGRELYFYADEVVPDKTADASAAKATDDTAWTEATTLNSVAGFDNYLARYPSGAHADEARSRRAALVAADAPPAPPPPATPIA